MSHAHAVLAPTSSLPRLRNATADDVTEDKIASALRNLTDIYCALPRTAAFRKSSLPKDQAGHCHLSIRASAISGASTPLPVDSGYASGEEDDEENNDAPSSSPSSSSSAAEALRYDEYERQFAVRWLTGFIARAQDLLVDMPDDVRQRFIDEASYILASFSSATDAEEEDDGGAIVREFCFAVNAGGDDSARRDNVVQVRLTDGTPATGADHTDVGLQSWGASIVVADLMCADPARFGLSAQRLGNTPRIVELGAGTGLVGITMAKLLPRIGVCGATIIATDYHPAVLANLRDNVSASFPDRDTTTTSSFSSVAAANDRPPPVQTCLLDWAAPCLDAPLHEPADMLVATDVVYAPEHAVWLRDCAARLLTDDGVFWLVASVRPNGRFEGVTDTVETAFADCCEAVPRDRDGRMLRILGKEMVEKRRGVGRGDEIGYKVFRIGWQET